MKLFFYLMLFVVPLYAEDVTPVSFADLKEKMNMEGMRPWRQPDYSHQENAIGYETGAFAVPAGMEERVSFWIDIYTKYSTDQGLLHDSFYVNAVYEVIDFTDIMNNESLNNYQKQRARAKRVKERKLAVQNRLLKLSKYKSPAGLDGEDLRYWYMFAKSDEMNKFRVAASKKRLRFQLGQRDRFIKGIFLSGRHLEEMEKIFKDYNLPIELTRLPFVESSFNYKARSHVGASGIWQFMRYAARPYLKLNLSVDERNDPLKSTVAAAKLLRNNYKILENWPLAVTGYNHGPAGVRRLVRKYNTTNLVELIDIRKGRFGFASANFYASFLAALEVEKNAEVLFNQKLFWDQAHDGQEIILSKNMSVKELVHLFDGDDALAKRYNAHLRSAVWKDKVRIERRNFIRVPSAKVDCAVNYIKDLKSAKLYNAKTYKVAHGDTFSDIAHSFGIRLQELMNANSNINPRRLRPGQKIYIPIK